MIASPVAGATLDAGGDGGRVVRRGLGRTGATVVSRGFTVVGAGLLGVGLGVPAPLGAGTWSSSRFASPGSFGAASAESGASVERRLDVAAECRLSPTTVKPVPITMAVAPATNADRNRTADMDTDSVTSWVGAVDGRPCSCIGDRAVWGTAPIHYVRSLRNPDRISGALKARLSET
jgi:hypothetical protein